MVFIPLIVCQAILVWIFVAKSTRLAPDKYTWRPFLYSILFGLVIMIAYVDLTAVAGELVHYIVWAAMEELIKFLAVIVGTRRFRTLRRPTDVLLYGLMSVLGFTLLENMLATLFENTLVQGLQRIFISLPSHMVFTTIVMLFVMRYRRRHNPLEFAAGFAMAVLIHAFYNYTWYLRTNWGAISFAAGLVGDYIFLWMTYRAYTRVVRNPIKAAPSPLSPGLP